MDGGSSTHGRRLVDAWTEARPCIDGKTMMEISEIMCIVAEQKRTRNHEKIHTPCPTDNPVFHPQHNGPGRHPESARELHRQQHHLRHGPRQPAARLFNCGTSWPAGSAPPPSGTKQVPDAINNMHRQQKRRTTKYVALLCLLKSQSIRDPAS